VASKPTNSFHPPIFFRVAPFGRRPGDGRPASLDKSITQRKVSLLYEFFHSVLIPTFFDCDIYQLFTNCSGSGFLGIKDSALTSTCNICT